MASPAKKNGGSFLVPKESRPSIRRLSSMTATKEEIASGGPVVIVPPRFLSNGGNRSMSHRGFAASLNQARQELATVNLEEDATASPETASPVTPGTPEDLPSADSFAFAFDIDGVLVRGGEPIPEAIDAMKMLNGENEYGIKV